MINIKNESILYRADGSHEIGLGHIFRAKSLCLALKEQSINPIIITSSPEYIADEIASWGITVFKMPQKVSEPEFIIDKSIEFNANILIQDIRNTNINSISELKSKGLFLIHFDDLGHGRRIADVLIDANLTAEYLGMISDQVKLFGKKYMVLDETFSRMNKKDRKINCAVQNILITMGGSDPRNLTPWVTRIMSETFDKEPVNVIVVTGKAVKDKKGMEKLCADYGFIHLHNINNMPELLYNADIAVISGGITLYEASAAGTPSITLPQVDHQTVIAREFEREGITVCPFDENHLDEKMFTINLKRLYRDYNARKKMSVNGKKFVDGDGINRIIAVIKESINKIELEKQNVKISR